MKKIFNWSIWILVIAVGVAGCIKKKPIKKATKPNIVVLLADDLGWGDVQVYNPESKIPTPNLNNLAEEGMRFTDAHTASAVCTPTRYGLLTGRYPWRTRLKSGVLFPPANPLISHDRETLASLLKKQGYYTAGVGKWHLGLDWAMKNKNQIDFTQPISDSPVDHGFDESYIIAGSLDMPPYCYIKNNRVEAVPTKKVPKSLFGRPGLAVDGLKPEDVLPHFTDKVISIIRQHAQSRNGNPLFLYFPLNAPHKPVAPSREFQGKTKVGAYGDYVYEVDTMVGRVLDALKENGMYDNTLLIMTSDNGTSPNAAKTALARGHDVNGPFRGMKADIWEGGHRVPFFARWPGHIPAGVVQDETISLNDLMATFSAVTGGKLSPDAGVDSYNILPALLNKDLQKPIRPATVVASIDGYFGMRKGKYKIDWCAGSGGWAHPRTQEALKQGMPSIQLYNLDQDPGEQNNLYKEHPEMIREMETLMNQYITNGRSNKGPEEENWQGATDWKQINWTN